MAFRFTAIPVVLYNYKVARRNPFCYDEGMETTLIDQLLLDLFRELGLHQPEHILAGHSLSLSEIFALIVLARQAPLSQQELGSQLLLEKSTISRLVSHLERRKWVVRIRDAHDRRLRLLCLSEQGNQMITEIQQKMLERHQQLITQLSQEEYEALVGGLSALLKALHNTL